MQIQIEAQPFAAISTEALVTFVFDKDAVSYTHLDVYKRQVHHKCRPQKAALE